MVAGDKQDPFSGIRLWLQMHTRDLTDPAWTRLTYEQRGIYDDLERYSLRGSDTPGFFEYDGEPMTVGDIARGMSPASVEEDAKIPAAMQELREAKLLAYDDDEGWSIPRWASRQPARIVEAASATKERESSRKRKRRQRGQEEAGAPTPINRFRRDAETQ